MTLQSHSTLATGGSKVNGWIAMYNKGSESYTAEFRYLPNNIVSEERWNAALEAVTTQAVTQLAKPEADGTWYASFHMPEVGPFYGYYPIYHNSDLDLDYYNRMISCTGTNAALKAL